MQLRHLVGPWRSRSTFVFVLAAAAVGLSNLWRFAYLLGAYGGALFLLAYLVALFTVAVPVLIAEVALGRRVRAPPPVAWGLAARRSRLGRGLEVWALLACVAGLLLLAYAVVVAGWSLSYAWHMAARSFAAASARDVAVFLEALLASPGRMLAWQSAFLAAAVAPVAFGVVRGIGAAAWVLLPALAALLWLLLDFSLRQGDLAAAQAFLFTSQPLDFDVDALFLALTQALFTLGVGLAVGTSFGAYAPERLPVGRSVLAVAVLDTAVALATGVIVFPLLFASNVAPDFGPGLLFVAMPYAFGNLPEGDAYGCLFYLAVVLAALGTALALLEPSVATLLSATRMRRWQAAAAVGAAVWFLAAAVAFSLAPASPFAGLMSLFDRVTANWLLPAGALAVAVFVGWRLDPALLYPALRRETGTFLAIWLLLLRFVAPCTLLVVLFRLAVSGG